jgi:protein-S-isoprenylcysteine O-methyltransferase Ste14
LSRLGRSRAILIVGFSFLFPTLLYYRIRSSATGEKIDRGHEGPLVYFTLRPVGVLFLAGLAAFVASPSGMQWSMVALPGRVRALGVVAGLCGGLLMVWSLRSLGRNLTDTVVTRKAHTLVMSGPYRWVRHPLYDALALLVLSASAITASWFLFLTGAAALALIWIRTRKEEEMLLERFGNQYRAYMVRTGRFLPRP